MKKVDRIDTIKQYHQFSGIDTKHPLVSVINFSDILAIQQFRRYMGLYAIFLKDNKCGDMTYGCQPYDYEDGTLVFVSPGHIYGIDSKEITIKPSGYGLLFHPDLISDTSLGKSIKNYTFFSYEVNEALHLSKKERENIIDCLKKIAAEIELNIDKHSKTLIVSNIEVLLNYCMRFYDRQFITRSNANKSILMKFENLLTDYFLSKKAQDLGIPNVTWCAEQLHLSPNYFGDLIKKETGNTALSYIQSRLIEEAKLKILDANPSINDVSFQLGFKYQQHFTRLFKQKTGMTPIEYQSMAHKEEENE